MIAGVRPSRPNGKSEAWETVAAQHDQIKGRLDQGLTLTKVHTLLGRRGVVVSYRTLNRYATTELGFGQRRSTVRVADCEPGAEVQVDFGRLGMLTDASDGRRRVVHGLIFTAVYSRHTFVYPTYRQTLNEVIAGFEADGYVFPSEDVADCCCESTLSPCTATHFHDFPSTATKYHIPWSPSFGTKRPCSCTRSTPDGITSTSSSNVAFFYPG